SRYCSFFFLFNDAATTDIYPLSLHDALPIPPGDDTHVTIPKDEPRDTIPVRSEEHTSELQSREKLVCRLLLEKKKTTIKLFEEVKASTHEMQASQENLHK